MLTISILSGIVAAVFWYLHGQSIRKGYGFTFHWWSLVDLGVGVLIPLIVMTGVFLVEWLSGGIQIVGAPFDLMALSGYLPLQIFGAFFEEVIFRSLLLSGLVAILGGRKWPAILISAVFFGYVHLDNPGASYVSAFGNGLGGIMYGIAFLGGRNIWLPVGLHFGWNFFQGPVLGFPVSGEAYTGLIAQATTGSNLLTGGAYGPEAGLVGMAFRFVVIAMVLYYLQLRSGKQGEPKSLTFPIKVYDNPGRPERMERLRKKWAELKKR